MSVMTASKYFYISNEILTYKKVGNELKSAIIFMYKTGFTLFLCKVKKIDRFRLQADYEQQIQSGKRIDTKERCQGCKYVLFTQITVGRAGATRTASISYSYQSP